MPLEEMIQRLVGQGVKVSNIRVNCPSEKELPYGYFTDNTGSIGIDDGLLITSGSARNAIGPNNSAAKSQSNGNQFQDPDLAPLLAQGEMQYDACSIEFDVQVFADTLSFDYVFASEEYLEFIRDYHDVFGFFIYGPGIPVSRNLALVPGTNLPVSVSNINRSSNAAFYIDNGTGETPFDQLFLQYDGLTRRLTSKVAVIPCQTYSLKLAICDVKDDAYDAGIFIAGRSLQTKAPALDYSLEFPKFPHAIEGCNGIWLSVKRQVRLDEGASFLLAYSGSALRGEDYGFAPDTLVFLPGETEKRFFIPVLSDSIPEGEEELLIALLNPCPSLPVMSTIRIAIRESFDFELRDKNLCLGQPLALNPEPQGNYQWSWSPSNGLSCTDCPSPICRISRDITYRCQIRDEASNCEASDLLQVKVVPAAEAAFSWNPIAEWTSQDIQFRNDSQNSNSWSWDFGDGSSAEDFEPVHMYASNLSSDSTYFAVRLIARNDAACADTLIRELPLPPFFIPNLISPNADLKNDFFSISGIQPGYWSLEIFNRWGKTVWSDAAYRQDWSGVDLQDGVYFYRLSRENREFKGWVEIKR